MDKSKKDKTKAYSNVPISGPRFFPGQEEYRMNGFSLSQDLGLILSFRRSDDPSIDPLNTMRKGISKRNQDRWRKKTESTIEKLGD